MKAIRYLIILGSLGAITWLIAPHLKLPLLEKPQLQTQSLSSQIYEGEDELLMAEIQKWKESELETLSTSRFSDMYSSDQDLSIFKYRMDLDVVILSGSGWNLKSIKERLIHMGETFKACKIKFENIYLIKIRPKISGQLDYYPWYPPEGDQSQKEVSTFELAKNYPNTLARASITYLRQLTTEDTGAAGAKWYFGPNSPMLYKQFISIETESPLYKWKSRDDYSVEAHELGHALFDIHHEGTDNIMAIQPIKRSMHIRQNDCKKALAHDLTQRIND